jgi:sulfur-carrier protein adenylyltransferase/sulfurtransferase
MLASSELQRYARQLMLSNIGQHGQQKLKNTKVLLVGVGGLGSACAPYLAAAGVGHLGLIDDDKVDVSNLQRQILYGENTLRQSKVESAQKRLQDLNPLIKIETHATRLDATNILEILEPYNIIVDGSDNFTTRYLINDACVQLEKPNVYASVLRFAGQLSTYVPNQGPCYRCLFTEPPDDIPSCSEAGVLGVLPGVLGTLQATEVLKLILQTGEPLNGRLLMFDALKLNFREIKFQRDAECQSCGVNRKPSDHKQSALISITKPKYVSCECEQRIRSE